MGKNKTSYVCSDCGGNHARWLGQCPDCKAWNTITEFKEASKTSSGNVVDKGKNARALGYSGSDSSTVYRVKEIPKQDFEGVLTGMPEFDRVMGGKVTKASVNLFSGDPGAGKTTLLSQVSGVLSLTDVVLYVTSEESPGQFRNRFSDRLKIKHNEEQMKVMSESNIDVIMSKALEIKAKYLVVDSIQSVHSIDFTGSPGSVGQVKNCAQALTQFAKTNDITIFLTGHVNKSNEVAGPKTLVHIIDGLFHIEVNDSELRCMRPTKNRFGDIETVGLFKMTEKGMIDIENPSKIFLSSLVEPSPGAAIACIRDGTRNLLLELQALVTESEGERPERVCIGLNHNRLKMIGAILRKHGGMKFNNDVYVSLVGGFKLPETDSSADLSLAAALFSSYHDQVVDKNTCFIGELSLSGEVRPVNGGVYRVKEAVKHGFTRIYVPEANYHKNMERGLGKAQIVRLKTVDQMLNDIRPSKKKAS